MTTVLQDIRFALRMLRRNPALSVIVVLTLALGIGSNATIYSAARVFLLDPWPGLRQPDHLVRIVEVPPQREEGYGEASAGVLLEVRRAGTAFEEVAACEETLANLTGKAEPERVLGIRATANYFRALGFTPAVGRGFAPGEDQPGRDAVTVLSDGFWQRRYGRDRSVVGQTISLNGRSVTIIGVMPPRVSFPEPAQLWVPLALDPQRASNFADRSLIVFARLKPGTAIGTSRSQLPGIASRMARDHPVSNTGWGLQAWPLVAYQTRFTYPFMVLVMAAAGLVLVIVCANVANLLLARGSVRQREFALRTALGASQLRVFRQGLTESLLLALLGGACGVLVAQWGIALLRGAVPGEISQGIPAWDSLAVNARVLGYTALITLAVGLFFGSAPSLSASRVNLQGTLKEGERSGATGSRGRLRRALAISEVALALTLLVSTGLMVESFAGILRSNPGFRTDHLLTMDVTLPPSRYRDARAMGAFYTELSERVRALAGVRAMALVNGLPLSGWDETAEVEIVGGPTSVAEKPSVGYRVISDGYFEALGIPVLRGRGFDRRDQAQSKAVAIASEALAKLLWPGADPLGRRLRITGEPRERELIGVVRGVRGRNYRPPRPTLYVPLQQATAPMMALVVRTAGDPTALAGSIQRQIAAIDPTLAAGNVQTFERVVVKALAPLRITTGILVALAALALLLAGLGIYGVISFAVARRTHEIGVRLAIGAQRRAVLGLIVRQGMQLALVGVAIGLAGAVALCRGMASVLYGVNPTDLAVYAAATAVLVVIAVLASYVPARRAAALDPLVALRTE
jgi:putative ABC transport system permease protein